MESKAGSGARLPLPRTIVTADAVGTQEAQLASLLEAEKRVFALVLELVEQCDATDKGCWDDPDFGPYARGDDEHGAHSLYVSGEPKSELYPDPDEIYWLRPGFSDYKPYTSTSVRSHNEPVRDVDAGDAVSVTSGIKIYGLDADDTDSEDDENEEEDEEEDDENVAGGLTFCDNAKLFVNGSEPGDVVQGQLGDCYLLGALAALSTQEHLIKKVFFDAEHLTRAGVVKDKEEWCRWNAGVQRKYGIYVCRFMKDFKWHYVIVSDKIPCFVSERSATPCFARGQNRNEIWPMIVEKAYGKLHGSYGAIATGFIDIAVHALTGFPSERICIREGHSGFVKSTGTEISSGAFWERLLTYKARGCIFGASIAADPSNPKGGGVEESVGQGLNQRHAYSIIDLGTTTAGEKLLRIRNPWGYGEWSGNWSDTSTQMKENAEEVKNVFPEHNADMAGDEENEDGIFVMSYRDFLRYFTHVYAGLRFPGKFSGVVYESDITYLTSNKTQINHNRRGWMEDDEDPRAI